MHFGNGDKLNRPCHESCLPQWIQFRLWRTAVFMEELRCTSPTAFVVLPTLTVVAVSVRPTRACWLSRRRAVQRLAIARSQWLRQERGTDCLRLSELWRHLCLFARSWRRFFSGGALINFSSLDTHYTVWTFLYWRRTRRVCVAFQYWL